MSGTKRLLGGILVGVLTIAGCSSSDKPMFPMGAMNLGISSHVDAPTQVAAVRTFYVAPNNQLAMSNSFSAGVPLRQVFAERIANTLTTRGLTQAPAGDADATVVFAVRTAASAPAAAGDAEGIGYADQLLAQAQSLQTNDNFLEGGQIDMRISITRVATNQVIWHGSIAGVAEADQSSRGRLLDMLQAVDRLLSEYPKVQAQK